MKLLSLLFAFLVVSPPAMLSQDFKVIGYLPYYRFGLVEQIDLEKLNYLNLAFANPDLNGNLSTAGHEISGIVGKAHHSGVKVYISLAGAVLTPSEEMAWQELLKPSNRSAFIGKIIEYTNAHNLDGIDVDLEWSHVDDNYSDFILQLRDSVDKADLGLSAALPGHYRYPQISDAAMHAFDWINMMVYDLTGPWSPQNPGPHSTYDHAVQAINYWTQQGMAPQNLTLGVPFYGYDFSDLQNIVARTYAEMVALDPGNANLDQVGAMYYNGLSTIRRKTELALESLGGIMIWEIGQDDFGDFSLLDHLWETVEMSLPVSHLEDPLFLQVFPVPFTKDLEIKVEDEPNSVFRLYNVNGRMIQLSIGSADLGVEYLPAGTYFLEVTSPRGRAVRKLVKK